MEKVTTTTIQGLLKEIPYMWRVQSFSKFKPEATCVAYIDARDAMRLLDEVVGVNNWQDEYVQVKNTMICRVGIKIEGEWIWKSDGGTETDVEAEKGELSDAFKRACVKWGIGRFLYDLGMQTVDANSIKEDDKIKKEEGKTYSKFPYPVDKNGKRIWDLTAHLNGTTKNNTHKPTGEDTTCPQCSQAAQKLPSQYEEGKFYVKCLNCKKNFTIK